MKKFYYISSLQKIEFTSIKHFFDQGYSGSFSFSIINSQQVLIIADELFTDFLFTILPTLTQDLGIRISIIIAHLANRCAQDAGMVAALRKPSEILHLAELILLLLSDKNHPLISLVKEEFTKIPRDLYLTASAYLKAGLNATKASKKLYIHRNTFRYRLNQFIEFSSLDIRDHFHALYFIIGENLTK